MSLSTVLAKALFDNVAESAEELAFRKGDILMVLEQDGGGPGWWLCSLHGRQGIAPANRLRLLNTTTPPSPAPNTDPAPAVYLSPHPAEDAVYLSPPSVGAPRGRSSSASRPRQDWETPTGHTSDGVYQAPSGLPRPAAGERGEGGYLVPRVSTPPSEDVYQTPTGGVAHAGPTHTPASELSCPSSRKSLAPPPLTNGVSSAQDGSGLYQTPSQRGGGPPKHLRATAPSQLRLLPCAQTPPPPTAVQRGTPKHGPGPQLPGQAAPGLPPAAQNGSREGEGPNGGKASSQEERLRDGGMEEEERKRRAQAVEEGVEYELPDDESVMNQVYDTPPSSRWQHTAVAVVCVEDSIYNTPRAHSANTEPESEVYDVPSVPLPVTADLQQQTYSIPACIAADVAVEEEDVYSVPALPGDLSAGSGLEAEQGEVYSVPGPASREEGVEPEEGGGIYDMPAHLGPPRRASVSSTSSGDSQWRPALSALIQSALSSASLPAPPPQELAASLSEILSVWKADSPSPPLLQAWSRLSDLLPALSACGAAPPSDTLLSLVRRALEESASLLQIQGTPSRPRLPSQDSLSRRPLPALPVAEVKPLSMGMGGRKGSWIQERPLPPPPPPAFPLPPAPPIFIATNGQGEEEELGNEYAGIGQTPALPSVSGGDSVGYVKLQGKPDPPSVPAAETSPPSTELPSSEQRLSPSPPLPLSLSLEDSELLSFYSSQSLSHLSCLADSIDALFTSVQGNQPPRAFVSRGKSLIVTAHKLVFIGDTLSRLLTSPDLRAKVTTAGGRLCQALKAVVVATKGAAQNYPSLPATQEMVDRVAELSQHAAGFSGLLQRLADIS
ncbi:hypothetical protein GJAV_G00156090 [Gymnothorax javanicus]|nr:hypothetical protein GJAV_G00156090 [Gymnothorax javanicus]